MTSLASRLQVRALGRATHASTVRRGSALFLIALGIVGVHIVDDNFLQPEPGTSAGDHVASGLIPIALVVILAAGYPRLRAGLQAMTAMTVGALAVTVGVPAAYFLLDGNASGDDFTGLLAVVAGVSLLLLGPVTLWQARRTDGNRRRRYLRRALIVVATPVLAWAIVWFIVFPIGFAYIYVHTGRSAVTPDLGVPYETVTVVTNDSLNLAASYVPSRNRAAVVLFPGATRSREARMLIRHGYGVLLLDPRGQGSSEGDIVRWAGDRDLWRLPISPSSSSRSTRSCRGLRLFDRRRNPDRSRRPVAGVQGDRHGGRGQSRRRRGRNWPRPSAGGAEPGAHDRRVERLLEPRPAAADRESYRAYRTPLGLLDPRRPRTGRGKHTEGRSTMQRPGSQSRSGRCLVQHTPAASRLAPTSMSVGHRVFRSRPSPPWGRRMIRVEDLLNLVYPSTLALRAPVHRHGRALLETWASRRGSCGRRD